MPLAEVVTIANRRCLRVAGVVVAAEGTSCFDPDLPDELYEPIPEQDLLTLQIGGVPAKYLDRKVVRAWYDNRWTAAMLEHVAYTINDCEGCMP